DRRGPWWLGELPRHAVRRHDVHGDTARGRGPVGPVGRRRRAAARAIEAPQLIRRATAPAPLRAAHADGRPTRILHVGRHAADVGGVGHPLQVHGTRSVLQGTFTLGDCLDRLTAEPFDAVLLDERASDASAPEVLRVLRARQLGIPVILLLREADEWAALDAVKTGVHDYLIKRAGDLGRLPLVLGHAAEHHRLRE